MAQELDKLLVTVEALAGITVFSSSPTTLIA